MAKMTDVLGGVQTPRDEGVKALSLRLDAPMRRAVSAAAGLADVSRTEWIRRAIAEKLEKEGVKADG